MTNHNKVYYLECKEVTDPLIEKQMESRLLSLFKSIMTKEEGFESIVFGENDSLFIFLDDHRANKITSLTKELGVFKSLIEISDDILINKYIDDNFHKTFTENIHYKEIINNYIINNLTTDLVLDKINEHGIDHLTSFDYCVLGNIQSNVSMSNYTLSTYSKKTYQK